MTREEVRDDQPPRRLDRHFSMIRSFHLADLFTLGNGACGTAAILLSMAHVAEAGASKLVCAGALLAIALALDVLDGRIARWRRKSSAMGRELDSLSDVISFGVAPAAMAWAAGLRGALDVAVLLYFVCCGISRLARYNITAERIAEEGGGKVRYFEGTPIPTSILLVAMLAGLALPGRIGQALPLGAYDLLGLRIHPLVLLFAASGTMMISKTLRIPKP
jgi:CDP-diacylglycerol--serine O-phosphatidyltransferase